MAAHDSVYSDIFSQRMLAEAIEITCNERFERTLKKLELGDGEAKLLAAHLRGIHMARVREVTHAPQARLDAMRQIAAHYRLGLISNFDDAETGHLIVTDTGIRELFDAVIISADTGVRKPNPIIFESILEMMKLAPSDILFVGDTPHDDVLGAKQAGMHAAWINRRGIALPEDVPAPDIVIADLADLPTALGI